MSATRHRSGEDGLSLFRDMRHRSEQQGMAAGRMQDRTWSLAIDILLRWARFGPSASCRVASNDGAAGAISLDRTGQPTITDKPRIILDAKARKRALPPVARAQVECQIPIPPEPMHASSWQSRFARGSNEAAASQWTIKPLQFDRRGPPRRRTPRTVGEGVHCRVTRQVIWQLAKALAFICGPDHPTTIALKAAAESGAERDIKNARTLFLRLKPSDRRAALAMINE